MFRIRKMSSRLFRPVFLLAAVVGMSACVLDGEDVSTDEDEQSVICQLPQEPLTGAGVVSSAGVCPPTTPAPPTPTPPRPGDPIPTPLPQEP